MKLCTNAHPCVSLCGDGLPRVERDHFRSPVGQGGKPCYLILTLCCPYGLRVHGADRAAAIVTQDIVALAVTQNVLNLYRNDDLYLAYSYMHIIMGIATTTL